MTIEAANRLLIASLTGLYDEREASSICSLVMERLTGMTRSQRVLHKTGTFTLQQEEWFGKYLSDLLKHRPVQYVLKEAWFGALSFYTDENVLIPRPETEELVDWLLKENVNREPGKRVLDIGTGSGCIPVYIKKKRPDFQVMALDISEAALDIAKKNSGIHCAEIEFILCDIRRPGLWEKIPESDLIISNPPYIPEKQKQYLEKQVREFEPSLALFVPDEDPILFYKIIGDFAFRKLRPGGTLYLEIHHDYASDIMQWYREKGFVIELKKDFSGKDRMIKAGLP
jgi:release factor glutamine methyltransferase